MTTNGHIDLSDLPAEAQQEVHDFYLFVKQRLLKRSAIPDTHTGASLAHTRPSKETESALLSEKSLSEDWNRTSEDVAWKDFQ